MLFRTQSAAVYGIDADLVDIEVDLTPARNEADTPASVTIVGLPDAAVRESRERIRAAINNSAFFFPFHKTTINLAPADVRKEGASFDLPIALGILGANGDLGERENLTDALCAGELSLDGRVRPIKGALSIAIRAREAGIVCDGLPEGVARDDSELAVVYERRSCMRRTPCCHGDGNGRHEDGAECSHAESASTSPIASPSNLDRISRV